MAKILYFVNIQQHFYQVHVHVYINNNSEETFTLLGPCCKWFSLNSDLIDSELMMFIVMLNFTITFVNIYKR